MPVSPGSPAAEAGVAQWRHSLTKALTLAGVYVVSVEGRVKTEEAIAAKRARRPSGRINDLLGMRVIVAHRGLVRDAAEKVQQWADQSGLRLAQIDDHFERPGVGGYRALHLDYEIPDPRALGLPEDGGLEIQITTALLAAVARISHDLVYRTRAIPGEQLARDLEDLTLEAVRLDRRLEAIVRSQAEPGRVADDGLG